MKENARVKIGLLVDPNNGCNLNCIHCGLKRPHLVHFTKQEIMQKRDYEKMLQILKGCLSSISIGCIREPLVHPQITDLILLTDELENIDRITLTTNGILLDEGIVELIISTRHKWQINVSIESANEANYEKIRKGANFDTFKKNIAFLIESKDRAGKDLQVTFSSVIMKTNIHEYFNLLDFADSMGINSIMPMPLCVHDDNKKLALSEGEQLLTLDILGRMEENAKNTRVNINSDNYEDKFKNDSKTKRGSPITLTAIMNQSGHIYPPGHRKPIGCIFNKKDLNKIFDFYHLENDMLC